MTVFTYRFQADFYRSVQIGFTYEPYFIILGVDQANL